MRSVGFDPTPFSVTSSKILATSIGLALLFCATGEPTDIDLEEVVEIVVSPGQVSLFPWQTQHFVAYGRTHNGDSTSASVNWTASGGQIQSDGTYVANGAPGDYLVVATHTLRTWLADTAYVTVQQPGTSTGDLRITATTTGQDLDPDGYLVVVDGSYSRSIGINGSVTFSNVAVGNHAVQLSDLADNCTVGQNPRTVDVPAEATAETTFDVTCTSLNTGEVAIPIPTDWTDWGTALSPGPAGSWDRLLNRPATMVKKNDVFYLYYIGASGNRADGGPANRKLGVATSTDGISFTRYSGNPVVTHAVGIPNCDECGVFSAGAFVDDDGTVVMYYGGMEETDPGSVDGDVGLATSADGLDFTNWGDVFRHSDGATIGDDELFAIGAYQHGGVYNVYYMAKGGGYDWDLALARGPEITNMSSHEHLDHVSPEVVGAGDPIALSASKMVVPLLKDFSRDDIEMRTTALTTPGDLGQLVEVYDFSDLTRAIVFMDRETQRWYVYYLNLAEDAIRVKTAPVIIR
ncbi:MAG: hypothetical protein JSW71_21335 [Gemmatimonadota bacterium]|nr:MAG: hypothetical protein JSW71_21335 [Gemmatimonadota bacterium]